MSTRQRQRYATFIAIQAWTNDHNYAIITISHPVIVHFS